MQNVSNLSILAMLIMYMLSALFGYLTFYGKSNSLTNRKNGTIGFCLFCSALLFFCLARIPIFPFLQSQYFSQTALLSLCITDNVEAELLHTFTKVYKFDTMLLLVRLAVLTAVTLTVPIVLFPVSTTCINTQSVSVLSSGSRKSCLYGKISCLELISNLFHHSPSSFGASFRQQFNLIYVRAHEHKHHACKC